MTKDERVRKAMPFRQKGYNCAQAVGMAFTDLTGMDEETTAHAVGGFGGGVGAQGEVCGVVAAFAFLSGMIGDASPAGKSNVYKSVRDMSDRFRALNGCILCRELKGKETPTPCDELIRQGVEIASDYFSAHEV